MKKPLPDEIHWTENTHQNAQICIINLPNFLGVIQDPPLGRATLPDPSSVALRATLEAFSSFLVQSPPLTSRYFSH